MLIPFSEILNNCVIATVKILILCLAGVLLARKGILKDSQIRALSKLAQDIFIPCLTFTNFIAINASQLFTYSPLILVAIGMIFLGIYVGRWTSQKVVKEDKYFVVFQAMCGFAHTLNIELSMIETLAPLLTKIDDLTGSSYETDAESRGIIFIMLITMTNTIFQWSYLTKLIKENEKDYRPSGMGSGIGEKLDLELKLMSIRNIEPKAEASSPITPLISKSPAQSSKWDSIRQVINPPLFSALIGITIALIPPLQQVFISESSIVYHLFTQSAKFVSEVSFSILLIVLGANFGQPPSKGENTSIQAVATVTGAKMILMPLIGFIFIIILKSLSIMEDFTMMTIILITCSAPSANNILVQYASLGKELGIVSKLVLATYIASIITMPLILVVFFSIFVSA